MSVSKMTADEIRKAGTDIREALYPSHGYKILQELEERIIERTLREAAEEVAPKRQVMAACCAGQIAAARNAILAMMEKKS